MAEKTRIKDSEKSLLIVSFNWKEEMMLKKRLDTLDSMKKQVEAYYSLDQRILYNRFQIKLRRSQLAHARQMGYRDIVQQLSSRAFSFNTTVTDESESAVRQIVTKSPRERAKSAGYSKTRGPTPRCLMSACSTRRLPDGGWDLEHRLPSVKDTDPKAEMDCTTSVSVGKRVSFRKYRPHTSSALPPLSRSLNTRPHTAVVSIRSATETHIESEGTRGAHEGEELLDADFVKGDASITAVEQSMASGRNSNDCDTIKRPDSRSDFLNSRRAEEEKKTKSMPVTPLVSSKGHGFGGKMSSFVDRLMDLKQQQSTTLTDYYCQRLQESFGGSRKNRNSELFLAMEEDLGKWHLVGNERASRSITIRDLDQDFSFQHVPTEVLALDSYNAVITKENRQERHWIDNNPYPTATSPVGHRATSDNPGVKSMKNALKTEL